MSWFRTGPPREIRPGVYPWSVARPLRRLLEIEFAILAVGYGEPILDTTTAGWGTYLEQVTRDG